MFRNFIFFLIAAGCFFGLTSGAAGEGVVTSSSRFYYWDSAGALRSAELVTHFWRGRAIYPQARVDARIDPRLRHAASIAEERANAHSQWQCWRAVKNALLASGVIGSYPKTNYASEAGDELVRNFGFTKLAVHDPYDAPLGAVLVFSEGNHGAGHVAFRTRKGFASDYATQRRCRYPLLAVYGKFSS